MSETAQTVSPQWLEDHLDDSDVVIIDCRFSLADPEAGRQQYLAGHIPEAYYFDLNQDLSSPVGKHGGRHPLPDSQELAEKLASIGVTFGQTQVVAYDDSQLAFAARLWWLLRYLGHDRVAVLDGSWSGWQADGRPTTTALPLPHPGQFEPQVRHDWVVDYETVKARKDNPDVVLIDSRDRDRYRGEREPIDPIAGHIPGALNYPWKAVTDDRGVVQPPEWQRQHWTDLPNAEEVMVYCGSGVTACVNLFSLELANVPNLKLYAGSWSDWCSYQTEKSG
jgi:thiosulfate/3-mercaptopyruvate sulfurtransferase